MPEVQLNGIEFSIKSDTTSAVVSIDRLRQALSKLQKIHVSDLGLKATSSEISRFARAISKLDTAKLDSLAKSLRGITGVGNMFGKMADDPSAYAGAFQTMTDYLKQMSVIDFTNLSTAAQSINQIATSANRIGNKAADGAKSAASGIKQITKEAKKSASPLSNLLSSLKRIAFYRIIRSIIKSITEAFQEGLKNAYEFSKATGDRAGLAEALDTLATKSLTMKNQLGAAFGQLLTAITPIVVQIIGWVNKLAEALTRLIAILGGSDTYLRAKDVWTEWGEAAAGAGGAAKKALEYLAPFDELNVLPDPKSGGGGGGSAANIGDMFEYVNTSEGNGFLDTIKDMLDSISNFFENKDWAAIADSAWEGLKSAFSDTGKATEVIRSLFEALGSAIGAASAFVGEFCRNIAREIHASFKRNLIDYDGDGKISAIELIGALVVTGTELIQEITDWVKTNIVDPFVDGFSKAIGMSGKEELYDAIVNLGIDIANGFINNVINPLKEKWNEFADWLYEKTHGKVDWRVEMTAEIAHVDTAGLTASQKVISGITAGIAKVNKDGLTTDQKTIPTIARFSKKVDDLYDSATQYGRQIVTIARFSKKVDNLSDSSTPYGRQIATIARFSKKTDDLTDSSTQYGRQIWTIARFAKKTDDLTDSATPYGRQISTIARFVKKTDDLTDSTTQYGRQISTIARFTARDNALTEDQRTFSSWAKFNDYKNALGTPLLNSNAYITDYRIDSSIRYYGDLSVDAYVNIRGQTNTPTVAVNAYYTNTNERMARGGAYYGSMWHDIPQYASGTTRAGSLFVAGEAGPEVVGHIGGRTEVLNRSQLAATMYSAVRSAMASTAFRISATPNPSYNTTDGTGNEDVLYRAFRRALDETDFGGDIELDGQTLYRAMVNRNRQNTRLTGVNAMA